MDFSITLVDCPPIAVFSIFAFNGIVIDRDRESQLSGWLARVQQGRKNINGSGVVILVALMRKLFGAIY